MLNVYYIFVIFSEYKKNNRMSAGKNKALHGYSWITNN